MRTNYLERLDAEKAGGRGEEDVFELCREICLSLPAEEEKSAEMKDLVTAVGLLTSRAQSVVMAAANKATDVQVRDRAMRMMIDLIKMVVVVTLAVHAEMSERDDAEHEIGKAVNGIKIEEQGGEEHDEGG